MVQNFNVSCWLQDRKLERACIFFPHFGIFFNENIENIHISCRYFHLNEMFKKKISSIFLLFKIFQVLKSIRLTNALVFVLRPL